MKNNIKKNKISSFFSYYIFEKKFTGYQKDICFTLLFSFLVFYALSIFSYSPLDPGWNSFSFPAREVSNLNGIVGANLSSFFIYYFGLAALLLPIPFFIVVFYLIKPEPLILLHKKLIKILLAFPFLLIPSIYTISIVGKETYIEGFPLPSGGVIGKNLENYLHSILGFTGSVTVIIAISILGFIYYTQKSYFLKFFSFSFRTSHSIYNALRKMVESSKSTFEKSLNTHNFSNYPQATEEKTAHPLIYDKEIFNENSIDSKKTDFFMHKKTKQIQKELFNESKTKELMKNLEIIFWEFGVEGLVTKLTTGPVVNVFEFQPAKGVKQSQITNLINDLALRLKVESIFIYPIKNKSTLGIEVPAKEKEKVTLGELVQSEEFKSHHSHLPIAIGISTTNEIIIEDLSTMPHILIAGTTGSGKSVFINSIINGILVKSSPENVRFLMIDPKILELSTYNGTPHLLCPVITEVDQALLSLDWAISEMERRYKRLAKANVRNIVEYNALKETSSTMPYIVIVIDELADLMLSNAKDFETSIQKLAQKSRACGIHLILATQRPSVDILTGKIKANFPTRVSFQVASVHDSRTIIDQSGAEKLLGKGDLIFKKPGSSLIRAQGANVDEKEISQLIHYLSLSNSSHSFEKTLIAKISKTSQ